MKFRNGIKFFKVIYLSILVAILNKMANESNHINCYLLKLSLLGKVLSVLSLIALNTLPGFFVIYYGNSRIDKLIVMS